MSKSSLTLYPLDAQVEQRLARLQAQPAAPAPRRGLIGTILLYRIEDTDRIIERNPLTVLAGAVLVSFGAYAVIVSVLEEVLA